MRIDSSDRIAGLPVLHIRDGLRNLGGNCSATIEALSSVFKVDQGLAYQVVQELLLRGLIEQDGPPRKDGKLMFTRTVAGNAFACARAIKPMNRIAADNRMREFLSRVEAINSGDEFVFNVARVTVFGSYATDAASVGDLDLAVLLAPKLADKEKHRVASELFTSRAEDAGKRFSNFVARIFWPHEATLRFLKSRSPYISLHDESDLQIAKTSRVVFSRV